MTDREVPPFLAPGLVENMQRLQRDALEDIRRITGIPAKFVDYDPPRAETGIALLMQEMARAHARRVESALDEFIAKNPGRTPVLRTAYDEETKTLTHEWTALEPHG